MINKLEKYFKNELSGQKLVTKKSTRSGKIYPLLLLLYFGILVSAIPILFFHPILSIVILAIFAVDFYLIIGGKKKGVLYNYFAKRKNINCKAFENGNNIKIGKKGFRLSLFKLKVKKTKRFLKKNNIDSNPEFIINCLKHREAINSSFAIFITGILVLAISVSLLEFVKIYLDVSTFTAILDKVKMLTEVDTNEIDRTENLVLFLILLVLIIHAFFYCIPVLFAKQYLEIKFKRNRELQVVLEYIFLVKKKKNKEKINKQK